jgi:hypothetical protein
MRKFNLAQSRLSDALVKHHKALEELDAINQLINGTAIENQMRVIHSNNQGETA